MYRDETGTQLFTLTGEELKDLISVKIEAQAVSISDMEGYVARVRSEKPAGLARENAIADRLVKLIAQTRVEMRGLAFARDHVEKEDVFKLTGIQLSAIHSDLDPTHLDIADLARQVELESAELKAAQRYDGVGVTQAYDQPQRWRRW